MKSVLCLIFTKIEIHWSGIFTIRNLFILFGNLFFGADIRADPQAARSLQRDSIDYSGRAALLILLFVTREFTIWYIGGEYYKYEWVRLISRNTLRKPRDTTMTLKIPQLRLFQDGTSEKRVSKCEKSVLLVNGSRSALLSFSLLLRMTRSSKCILSTTKTRVYSKYLLRRKFRAFPSLFAVTFLKVKCS